MKKQNLNYTFSVLASILGSMLMLMLTPFLLHGSDIPGSRWTHKTLAIKSLIAQQSPSSDRRLLILSGSNALFGLSAKTLEQKIGIPAINLASHAGLGLDYVLTYGKQHARPGDIFILPLEYELYEKDQSWHAKVYEVLVHDIDYYKNLRMSEKLKFIAGIQLSDWGRITQEVAFPSLTPKPLYEAFGIDRWGDIEFPSDIDKERNSLNIAETPHVTPVTVKIDTTSIKKIIDFMEYVHSIGSKAVIVYPCIWEKSLGNDITESFTSTLQTQLANTGIVVLGSPDYMAFGTQNLFDTVYHQIPNGRATSTEKLATLLLTDPESPLFSKESHPDHFLKSTQ